MIVFSTRRRRVASWFALMLALVTAFTTGAAAQGADVPQNPRSSRRLLDPTLDSPVRSTAPAVVLSAFRGEGTAEAQAGFDTGTLSFILKASAPFTESDKGRDTEFADLDGLGSGTTLSLTVSGLQWGPDRITEAQMLAREEWCKRQVASSRLPAGKIDCESFTKFDLTQLVDNAGVDEGVVDEFDRVRRLGWDIPVQYGFQAKVSPSTFDYLDPATLAPASANHVGYSVGGGLGIFLTPLMRLDLEASFETSHAPGTSTEVCLPLAVPGATQCSEQVLGGPTEDSGALLSAGLRRFFSLGDFDIGVNPRLSYRSNDDTMVLRAPIYFIPQKSGDTLIGGISPAWNFDRNRFGIVLFVGPAFDLDAPIVQ